MYLLECSYQMLGVGKKTKKEDEEKATFTFCTFKFFFSQKQN